MIRMIIIGVVILLLVDLIESFINKKKMIKVDPVKLRRMKQLFATNDTTMLISRAIRHTIQLEQWRNERARLKLIESEES